MGGYSSSHLYLLPKCASPSMQKDAGSIWAAKKYYHSYQVVNQVLEKVYSVHIHPILSLFIKKSRKDLLFMPPILRISFPSSLPPFGANVKSDHHEGRDLEKQENEGGDRT